MNKPIPSVSGSRRIVITGGDVILENGVLKKAAVAINGQKIASIGARTRRKGSVEIDAGGHYVSPGFIDTHIHGSPRDIFSNELRYGTTSILVAESCAPLKDICRRLSSLRRFAEKDRLGPSVLGFRLEGPYISKIKAGAQDRRYIRPPDLAGLSRMIACCSPELKMITVAPELEGAGRLIRKISGSGIIASLGHSYASYSSARAGIDYGIRHATHVFNAMRGRDGDDPGAVGAVLSDERVYAEVILDLVHVRPELCRILVKEKGVDKVILVTDSIKALRQKCAGLRGGAYRFGDGRLAGSSLTMAGAIKNAVTACGLSIQDAVKMASANPARLLKVHDEKGSIEPGKDADITIFDKDFNVKTVIVRGKILYRKRDF